MASIVISGDTSGAVTLSAPAISGTTTLTLPTTSGTLVVTGGAQTVQFAAGSAASPSITFTGDTNTGIFSPAADSIAFTEGGVESMRIDSSGNVGIGTTTPSGKMTVSESDRILDGIGNFNVFTKNSQAANLGGQIALGGVNGSAGAFDPWSFATLKGAKENSTSGNLAGYFAIATATSGGTLSERMRIDSSGNVGIGTSSPATRLDVQAAVSATPVTNGVVRIVTTGSNPATGSGGGLLFAQQNSGGSFVNYGSITGSRVNNAANNKVDLCFATGSPSDSIAIAERMRITTDGAVGIGTTNPLYRLSVTNGTGTNSGVLSLDGPPASSIYFFTNCSAGSFNGLTVAGDPIIIGAQNQSLLVGVHDGSAIRFGDTDMRFGIDSSERMRISSGGDVSIGTTSVGGRLTVYGSSQNGMDIRTTTAADVFFVCANTGGSAGTAAYILPIRTGSTLSFQGGIQWTGSAVAYNTSSDYRLKENITKLSGALDKVMQLNPVSYTWKNSGKPDNGFIAHELQTLFPNSVSGEKDAVFEDGSINPQCVDYSKLVATLTAAIQELNAKVEAQAAEIAALKGVK